MSIPNNLTQVTLNIEKELEIQLKKQIKEILVAEPDANCSRNGTHTKLFHTIIGTIEARVPRLRFHKVEYKLIEAEIVNDVIAKLCIELYGNGLSTYRISNTLNEAWNIKMSKSQVSNYCKVLSKNVEKYFATDLSNYSFEVIHLDGKYYRVKDINSNRKAVLMNAIGITSEGQKIHLHMDVKPSEDKQYIEEFLESLKTRIGDTDACFVIDGNNNLPTTVNNAFPNAKIQRCLSHVSRNIERDLKSIAGIAERKTITAELNKILFHTEAYKLNQQLKLFLLKYHKYISIFKAHLQSQYIWSWSTINSFEDCKTNNNIEGFHSMLESVTSQHNCFETSESLYRALICEIERYNELRATATSRISPANIEVNIKEMLNLAQKADLINLTITYNGIKRVNINIDKLTYDEIREILSG